MQVEHIKDLIPYAKNARKHNDRNLGMIEKSLNEVGAARSIVIDENNRILAGNGTVEAAAAAGIECVRVIEADGNEPKNSHSNWTRNGEHFTTTRCKGEGK